VRECSVRPGCSCRSSRAESCRFLLLSSCAREGVFLSVGMVMEKKKQDYSRKISSQWWVGLLGIFCSRSA
jgi:hypothetical protein